MTVGAAVWFALVTAHSASFVGAAGLAVIATFMLAGNLVSLSSVRRCAPGGPPASRRRPLRTDERRPRYTLSRAVHANRYTRGGNRIAKPSLGRP